MFFLLMITMWAIMIFMSIGVFGSSNSQLFWTDTSSVSICPAMPCWEIPLFSSSSMKESARNPRSEHAVKKRTAAPSCPVLSIPLLAEEQWNHEVGSRIATTVVEQMEVQPGLVAPDPQNVHVLLFLRHTEIHRTIVCMHVICPGFMDKPWGFALPSCTDSQYLSSGVRFLRWSFCCGAWAEEMCLVCCVCI